MLDALARTPPTGVGVRQLATQLDLSRSAVHRLLQTLADLHVARALPSGAYAPGTVMAAWSAFLAGTHDLLTAGADVLDRLVARVGETVYLFGYSRPDRNASVLLGSHCGKPVRYILETGSPAPLHAGAAGKAILAHLPERMIDELLAADPTIDPVAAKPALLDDLAKSRRRGYSASIGERIPEACGVAAAYFVDGAVAGSIGFTIPRYRIHLHDVEHLGALVVEAARELTALFDVSSGVTAPSKLQRQGGPRVVGDPAG